MSTKGFSIITAEVINNIVNKDPDKIYDAVKNAYIKHGQKQTVNPPSYFLKFPDKPKSRIIALPALITEYPRIAGIKWIASNPENISHGLKRASAVIILRGSKRKPQIFPMLFFLFQRQFVCLLYAFCNSTIDCM
jgi:N-[(2S)-2-amino-2-carboxyethyl]-L-glutamate dehydrogenase